MLLILELKKEKPKHFKVLGSYAVMVFVNHPA
jgi:hypothetical protein